MPAKLITVEVVFAGVQHYRSVWVELLEGSTIEYAIVQSGVLQEFPEITLYAQEQKVANEVGIFGVLKSRDDKVSAGDRVEIYRSLAQSAMNARITRQVRAQLKKKN